MKTLVTTILLLFVFGLNAQDLGSEVYKGKLGDKMITLFIQSQEHPCNSDILYSGMYKYDSSNKWIQLNISTNDKDQFILVEYDFTGVLILGKSSSEFKGSWISPDAERQLKVKVEKEKISEGKMEFYLNKFEKVNYENNDC